MGVWQRDRRTDAELLLATDHEPEAFGVFYRRHLPTVLGYLLRRLRDRDLAADLAGEVFAVALQARRRFAPERGTTQAWLLTIAHNLLVDSVRRGRVEDTARRRLGVGVLMLTDDDLAAVDVLVDEERGVTPASQALRSIPPQQCAAVTAHVLEEEPYEVIAARLSCSTSVVRQRVSRGLRAMRQIIEESP